MSACLTFSQASSVIGMAVGNFINSKQRIIHTRFVTRETLREMEIA